MSTETITLSVPVDRILGDAVAAEAERRGWSKAQYCKEALRKQVAHDQTLKTIVLPK